MVPFEQFPEDDFEKIAEAKKKMVSGLLWCIAGFLVTLAAYYLAKPYSKYLFAIVVFVIYGGFRGIRGLAVYLRMMKHYQDEEKFRRVFKLGLVSIVGVAVLVVLGLKLIDKKTSQNDFESESQEVVDRMTGVKFSVPPGFTKINETWKWETDTSSYRSRYIAMSPDYAIFVDVVADGKRWLMSEYYPADSVIIDFNDSLAFGNVKAFEKYFNVLDENYYSKDEMLCEPCFFELGEKTYYKSIGIDEDRTCTVNYYTFNENSFINICIDYYSENLDGDKNKESWADVFVSRFHYFEVP